MKIIHSNYSFDVIAYRGGIIQYPENSREAVQDSINAYPSALIELDLQLTKDNQVITFHDFVLDDLTNGNGLVKDHTLEQLRRLHLKQADGNISNSTIATLAEMLQAFPDQKFVLDLHENNASLFWQVICVVEEFGREEEVVIVSIAKGAIEAFRKLRPAWDYLASPAETRRFLLAGFFYLHRLVNTPSPVMLLPYKLGRLQLLRPRLIKELKRRGVKVWTCANFKPYENVNSPEMLAAMQKLGIQGVYTDSPRLLGFGKPVV